jgi:hypothetical protein
MRIRGAENRTEEREAGYHVTGKYLTVSVFGSQYRLRLLHIQDVLRDVPVADLRYFRMGECALYQNGSDLIVSIDLRDEVEKVFDETVCIVLARVRRPEGVSDIGFIVSDCEQFHSKVDRCYGMGGGE